MWAGGGFDPKKLKKGEGLMDFRGPLKPLFRIPPMAAVKTLSRNDVSTRLII